MSNSVAILAGDIPPDNGEYMIGEAPVPFFQSRYITLKNPDGEYDCGELDYEAFYDTDETGVWQPITTISSPMTIPPEYPEVSTTL